MNKKIKANDKVVYVDIEQGLLKGLPRSDQLAIIAQKDKVHSVTSVDERGYIEIEFEHRRPDLEITYHTIWVPPYCVKLAG